MLTPLQRGFRVTLNLGVPEVKLATIGNASLFTKVLFTIFVPLDPPLPTSKVMDFLLNFYYKNFKQNCEHSAKIANKPSKNCEQTEL